MLPEPLQASCHSAAVQRRQLVPIFSQAASASSLVTFDQGCLPGTAQRAAGRVEAVVRRGRVVAARLVGEHRDVRGREVDQLVVGGPVRHRVELVDLAVAVVVEAVAHLGAGRASASRCSGGRRPACCRRPRRRSGSRTAPVPTVQALPIGTARRLAVAVVVELSQPLRRVLDGLVGRRVVADPAGCARAGRRDAGADALDRQVSGPDVGAVVDHAVAVVVEAVADLDAAVRSSRSGLAARGCSVAS